MSNPYGRKGKIGAAIEGTTLLVILIIGLISGIVGFFVHNPHIALIIFIIIPVIILICVLIYWIISSFLQWMKNQSSHLIDVTDNLSSTLIIDHFQIKNFSEIQDKINESHSNNFTDSTIFSLLDLIYKIPVAQISNKNNELFIDQYLSNSFCEFYMGDSMHKFLNNFAYKIKSICLIDSINISLSSNCGIKLNINDSIIYIKKEQLKHYLSKMQSNNEY